MIPIFDGFFALYVLALGAFADDILKQGKDVGTSSNQALLGMLVVVLIIVVIYFARKQDKAQIALGIKIDAEREGMTKERKDRIDSLMKLLAETATALNRTATAETAMVASVDAMRTVISTNSEVIKEVLISLRKANGK